MNKADKDYLLEVNNLKKHFTIKNQSIKHGDSILKAVDDVSLQVLNGEILGIVGESGCGKSTLGKTVMGLYDKTDGEVLYRGREIFSLNKSERHELTKQMQMIFQDPYSSLNPRKNVGGIIGQPLRIHQVGSAAEIRERVNHLMEEVGLNPLYRRRYPHQFSGGQRQRIGIARSLALDPEFIVCDEAVSALDVSVQAQIINLLLDLQQKHDFTYLFIAHDLAVVEFIATRILVMYLGRVVEIADKEELVRKHVHPYSKALFEAFPATEPRGREEKKRIVMGDVPSPIDPPKGCHFHPRCPFAIDKCREEYPPLKEVSPNHYAACWVV
ncbi:MAG: ATP-binding cassette domain-containing protein [Spirochaetia bacterium]|nr:ATP-binding cassette domain-containing protein [Spirochaetia bacterium]MCF7953254.1 ATP-binding cassette domain-containing protein [Spirochaetales bacterium]